MYVCGSNHRHHQAYKLLDPQELIMVPYPDQAFHYLVNRWQIHFHDISGVYNYE